MANKFSNIFVGCLVTGATIFGAVELSHQLNAHGVDLGAELSEATELVTNAVQQRDARDLVWKETNEKIGEVDCNSGEVRFIYIGDQEWLNGAEQAKVINENTPNDFTAGLLQVAVNNGINTVCDF